MIFPWSTKRIMWWILLQIVMSPFGSITYREIYFADTLTSFNKISASIVRGWCYILSGDFFDDHKPGSPLPPMDDTSCSCGIDGVTERYLVPLVIFLPLWFRMLQCLRAYYNTDSRFPYVPNSIKYGIAMSVVLFGIFNPFYPTQDSKEGAHQGLIAYHVLWSFAFFATTFYSWIWDVRMDWELFSTTPRDQGNSHYPLLRARLLFHRHVWFYYFAIILDLFLRFLCTLTLVHPASHKQVAFIQRRSRDWLPALELFRRSMWSWLRLEALQIKRDAELYQSNDRSSYLFPSFSSSPSPQVAKKAPLPAVFSRVRAEQALRLEKICEGVNNLRAVAKQTVLTPCVRRRGGNGSGRKGVVIIEPGAAEDGDGEAGGEEEKDTPGLSTSMTAELTTSYLPEGDDSVMKQEDGMYGNADEDDGEGGVEEEEEEEEEVSRPEAQRAMERHLASRRATLIEVGSLLGIFVGLAVMACKRWVH